MELSGLSPDDDHVEAWLYWNRWGGNVRCVDCGSENCYPESSLAYAAPQTRHLRHIPSPQRKTSSPLSERVHSKTQHPPPRHDRPDEIRRPAHAAQTPHIQRPNSQLAAKSASRKPQQVAGSERPLAEAASVGVVGAGGAAVISRALILIICRMSYLLASKRFSLFFWQRKRQMLMSADPATVSDNSFCLLFFGCAALPLTVSAASQTAD